MRKTTTGLMAIAAGGAMLFSSVAQAGSIGSVFFEVASNRSPSVVGEEATFGIRDADRSVISTQQESGKLQTGDVIKGSFSIGNIRSPETQLGASGRNNLFGRFALEVESVNASDGLVSFGPSGDPALGSNVLFEFYESSTESLDFGTDIATVSNEGGFTFPEFGSGVSSGDVELFGAAGFGSASATYEYQLDFPDSTVDAGTSGDPDFVNLADFSGLSTGDPLNPAGSQVSLDWLSSEGGNIFTSGFIAQLGRFNAFPDSPNTHIQSSDATINQGSGGVFTSNATFNTRLTAVPTPGASLAGAALLGLMGVGYAVRRKHAAS
jgi:hypothetical protein